MDEHDLTAAYALNALDAGERARFEAHVATCERCRDELHGLWRVSAALAHGAGGPAPPPELRERILSAARAERPNVIPFRPRRSRALASVASIAAVALLAVGAWGVSVSRELDAAERELAVLGDPDARTFAADGEDASLVVAPGGDAALVIRSLPPAPAGKDYEIWVFDEGVPRRAGVFERPGVALLTRPVEPGQAVAVTLEDDGGVDAPTGDPLFTAEAT
ncbi:MAG: rskA2 [Gaiellaceae bacterium]|jgi:anti-sigma-K factor RskA|nr:rskA2 [Gaiellaceae bacterium]